MVDFYHAARVTWNIVTPLLRAQSARCTTLSRSGWEDYLCILTGDKGAECRTLRASCKFSQADTVLCGHLKGASLTLFPTPEGLYFSSDTSFEANLYISTGARSLARCRA
jgi:hypothetical protein